MPILASENPQLSQQELNDLLRKNWKELPEAKKNQYMAIQKKKRLLWLKGLKDQGNAPVPQKKKKAAGDKKMNTESAYSMFCKEIRPSFKAQNPGMNFSDLSKLVGKTWQELPDDERQVFQEKANLENSKRGKTLAIP